MFSFESLRGRAVLAPMAGVGDSAFRTVCAESGAACAVTEMEGLSIPSRRTASIEREDVGTIYFTPTEVIRISRILVTAQPNTRPTSST